ncbi:CDP-glucose 4,6-dehydratase [Marispirochaeta sp.]|uniref:CDP-glucose 4,6-dehydratase n=1 Tax=Marispirochaeta sp. TaxID=2038653 RepID=UPI0029C804AB|nr:CDP-glucose 4,6-dehydratase [Marispirochaeta sp.]
MEIVTNSLNPSFWKSKKVLVTGHTGFKGAWLTLWLQRLGADVTGIGLKPETEPNLFTCAKIEKLLKSYICDIRDDKKIAKIVQECSPDIAFHLAAQALVRKGYRKPKSTFSINVQGTVNILDSLRSVDNLRVVVAVTTDKVYKNIEHSYPYRETDSLGGYDPYSASKAAAEIAIACYRDSFFKEAGVSLSSVRAGNVIGGGDWAEDRLIPDAVRSWSNRFPLNIRRPDSIRPWQHVLEPLFGYMRTAEITWDNPGLADAYNFGPETNEAATVRQAIELARKYYSYNAVKWAKVPEGPHEAGWLSLEIAKARTVLGVAPRWSLDTAIEKTMTWYSNFLAGEKAGSLCYTDIEDFETSGQSNLL